MNVTLKEVKGILIAPNSSGGSTFKYPIGNKELTEKVKTLEIHNIIKYNEVKNKWSKV